MLQRAVEWGRVPTNAVRLTRKPPKPHRPAVQAIPPAIIELMRARLLDEGRRRDATLLVVLAYAGLRPQEALALEWRHVRQRTLLVERAVSDGQLKALKNRRQPRTVAPLSPLRDDLTVWRRASLPPAPSSPLFPSGSGGFWRASDWRNWRKRIYRPVAEHVGIDSARPYELRNAFASLLIHEGRLSVVDIAAQLGHNPTVCLDAYAHVMAEQRGAEPTSAEQQILRVRRRHAATGQFKQPPGHAPGADTLPAPAAEVEPLARAASRSAALSRTGTGSTSPTTEPRATPMRSTRSERSAQPGSRPDSERSSTPAGPSASRVPSRTS